MSRAAVVLVNYNNLTDTMLCVKSLLALIAPVDIILVDNASSEQGIDTVAALASQVVLLKSACNVGFGRGNNIGIRWALQHTSCEFIFILNNDTTIQSDAIQKMEVFMDLHPNTGMVAPRILMMEASNTLWYGGGYVFWPKGSVRVPGYRGSADSEIALTEREVSFASGCAMFIRRDVFVEIGGFDPRYFMYEEDVEFCLRMSSLDWIIRYLPAAVVLHRGQGSTRSGEQNFLSVQNPKNPRLAFFAYHITRNKLLNMYIYAKGKNFWLFWFCFPFYLGSKCVEFTIHGRFDAILAVFEGIKFFIRDRHSIFINELEYPIKDIE